jgi:nucleotide-binding universal stress UspA family protein
MKTILAPVDFSPISESVVRETATLAKALDARVVLLTVVQPPVLLSDYTGMMDLAQVTAAGEKNAARQLDRLEDKLKNQFIETESIQVSGSAIAHIIEQAEKNEADYIVMGSHGRTALYDLLVGSTTHGVLMRSKCPVIIVPAVKNESKRLKKEKRAVSV